MPPILTPSTLTPSVQQASTGSSASVVHAASTYSVYGWDPATSPLPKPVNRPQSLPDAGATTTPEEPRHTESRSIDKVETAQAASTKVEEPASSPPQAPSVTGTGVTSTSPSIAASVPAAAPTPTVRIAQALVAPVLVAPGIEAAKTVLPRPIRNADAKSDRSAVGRTSQIALKRDGVDANNSTTGQSPQEFGVRTGVGQTPTAANAPTSVATAKSAQIESEPKAEPIGRGKKNETTLENAAADKTATTVANDASIPAAKAEAKPLTHAERVELVRQVADQIGSSSLKPGNNQVTVQLHPGDWGSVNVRISVLPPSHPGGAAQVTAHLMAENTSVKAALDSHMGDLRKALEGSGLHLQDAVVTVQAASSAAQSGSTGSGAGNGSHGHPGSWDTGGSQNMAGNTTGQGGFASFTGGGQGGGGNSRPYQPMPVDAIEMPAMVDPTPAPSGRLDTRA